MLARLSETELRELSLVKPTEQSRDKIQIGSQARRELGDRAENIEVGQGL